ncbi:ShlB/FhaC/HecB family hemolysin secretion/activation protein [Roseateles sp.]|uniref:ShlB/FhaC/HecB family hemolysin secretion/activation protein n=1 Tax=Roseateles sp. TaxID=1971397 RepID=UPI003266CE1E
MNVRPASPRPLALHAARLSWAAALACSLVSAWAQTPPVQLPPGAEPGREPLRPVMPMPNTAVPQLSVPRSASAEVPPGAKELSFELKALVIEGATAFPEDTLRPLYAGLLGRRVTVAEAFGVAQAIETRYRSAGYVTSRVIVPQQTVDDGRFRVIVVEGFVANVVYQGDEGPVRAAVERLINGVRGVKPVTLAEIERRLLLANDLPGLTVRGTLESSPTEQGGSTLIVRVDRRATDGGISLDNRGSPYLGAGQLQGSYAWNALGARADRVSINAKTSLPTGRSTAVGASYDALLSDNGLLANLSASHARSNPQRELAPLDVKSRVSSASGTLSWPLIRSREQNLRAVAQFEARDVSTDLAATGFTRDRLRILRAGLSWDRSDAWDGITTVRGMLHQGLSGLGASRNFSPLASRVNGRSDFTKLTLDVTRLQQVADRWSLIASATSQVSRRPLLASEELGLGGASFGRAYDDGEIAGDNGVAAMLELRYVPAGLPRNVQLYGYVDGGRVWAATGGNPVPRAKLGSLGLGARAGLSDKVFATFEIAKPMNTEVRTRGSKHARAFVSVSTQF